MYEISLASFLVVFKRSLVNAKKAPGLDARLKNMVASMTREMYDYTCTGIFERHKLMFSFQMTIMIMEGDGELNREELNFFLKGDMSLEASAVECPLPWLSDKGMSYGNRARNVLRRAHCHHIHSAALPPACCAVGTCSCVPCASMLAARTAGWKDLQKLGTLETNVSFGALLADVRADGSAWKAWYDLESPEMEPLPHDFTEKLTPFQQLLVFRCFRPDRVYNGELRTAELARAHGAGGALSLRLSAALKLHDFALRSRVRGRALPTRCTCCRCEAICDGQDG